MSLLPIQANMAKGWAVLVCIIIANFSCKKDNFHKESVSGLVLHSVTKQPLVNQKISLWVNTYKVGKKDPPEWPNGKPIFTSRNYTANTDQSGKYVFTFEVEGEWMYTASLVTGEFIQKTPVKNMGFFFPSNSMILTQVREMYDTIFGEKQGYVRYQIKNINDTFGNDTLFALTYYQNKWIRPGGSFSTTYADYNLIFGGTIIDYTFTDTVPAESEPHIPVKWLHKRADTIVFRNELINLQPHTISDYFINY